MFLFTFINTVLEDEEARKQRRNKVEARRRVNAYMRREKEIKEARQQRRIEAKKIRESILEGKKIKIKEDVSLWYSEQIKVEYWLDKLPENIIERLEKLDGWSWIPKDRDGILTEEELLSAKQEIRRRTYKRHMRKVLSS